MSLALRTITTAEEQATCFDLLSLVYGTPPVAPERDAAVAGWIERQQARRRIVPSSIRGAFLDDRCVGSYQLDIRQIQLGDAILSVGCIGAVATHPDVRKQGIASALMWDAVTYAREQGLALLLLNGIANFYQRFGFANVTDLCEQHIALTTINSLPRSSYTVRAALPADSEALLGRYRRHHNCFERSRELQEHLQQKHPHWQLAIDPNGQICGYLVLHSKGERANAIEAVADDWQAGLALLHAHAAELPETERPAVLMWPLPLTSTTYYLLADQIELRSIITSIPQAEWMARIGSLAALVQQLLPHWQKRLQQFPVLHPLRLRHVIGDQEYSLAIDGPTIKLVAPQPTDRVVHMDPEVAIKLLFGYRPLRWAMAQPGQIIPTDLLPILERLYPIGPLWVPGSDHF